MIPTAPCPFCGWPAELFDSGDAPFWVECLDCFAQGPPEDTPDEAVAAWNQRTPTNPESDLHHG